MQSNGSLSLRSLQTALYAAGSGRQCSGSLPAAAGSCGQLPAGCGQAPAVPYGDAYGDDDSNNQVGCVMVMLVHGACWMMHDRRAADV